MDDDFRKDPEYLAWVEDIETNLIPKLADSDATVSIVPKGETDVKFAVELGFSIMMEKPIFLVVARGAKVPAKLAQIADGIIEADWDNPQLLTNRINRTVANYFESRDEI